MFAAKSERVRAEKIHVIPNGFDPGDFDPAVAPPQDVFRITYVGTMAESYRPGAFFQSVAALRKQGTSLPLRLRFVGSTRAALEPILQAQFTRGGRGEFKWVTTLYPTQAYAQDAEMSLSEYEDFVFGACHAGLDDEDPVGYWTGMQREQQRLVDALVGHDQVVVRGPSVDLTLSIKGRRFLNACGEHNMPDGEIFTGPVETSVNGWVRFGFPAVYQGNEVQGVELRFKEGRVAEAQAERNGGFLLRMLDTDAGSRFVGEFAIGNNYGIDRFTGQILFDEKIGGSFHLALGNSYPQTGGVNKSAIHWDLICDLRSGGSITVDDELLYRDGRFMLE
jgi:aminopeptidase